MAEPQQLVPVDDRAWPRGAVVFSVLVAVACFVAGAALVIAAADRGGSATVLVLIGFLAAFAAEVALMAASFRHRLEGRPVPTRLRLGSAVPPLLFFPAYPADPAFAAAILAGAFAGLMVANAGAVRAARSNRDRVDEAEAQLAASSALDEREPGRGPETPAQPSRRAEVGEALRRAVATARHRALAWVAATALASVGCAILAVPQHVVVTVVIVGAACTLWATRRLLAGWLALRDFTRSASPPRRAFVVLLHDPAPRMIRPLLGIWDEPPVVRQGKLPKPNRVFRCDDEQDALECHQGSVVVHEAWVDTGPRKRSKPRWIAADAGIVLPHRTALLGRWYLSSLLGAERPGPPRQLTLQRPEPNAEVVADLSTHTNRMLMGIGGRLAALTAAGALTYWLA